MKTALAYDVDEGECLDIQTLHGPVTFQAKECGNTWGFYKGGREKGRGKEVQATGSGSHSAAASKAPTKSALKPPRQTRTLTPASVAAKAVWQRSQMDVDKEVDSDDDDDDQGPGTDEEVVVQEEGTPEEDEPVPQTKWKTKKAKGKTAHPSFTFTGPASGGAKSISARPTRAEKTLTSTTYLQHLERAKSHVREELGSSLKQVATHYQQCLGVTGAAIVAEDGTPLNAAEDPRATSARRRESFGWALTGRCVVRVTLVTGQRLHTW